MITDQLERRLGCVLTRERVDDDPASGSSYERDVGDVVAAHLPNTINDFEQAVVCIQRRMSPQVGVYGVRSSSALPEEVVGADIKHATAVATRNHRIPQRSNVTTTNSLQVCGVWLSITGTLIGCNGVLRGLFLLVCRHARRLLIAVFG